jgi:hypothetical protein
MRYTRARRGRMSPLWFQNGRNFRSARLVNVYQVSIQCLINFRLYGCLLSKIFEAITYPNDPKLIQNEHIIDN